MGIVTDRLAKKIWPGKNDDQLTTYEFCLRALLALQFIVPIKRSLLPAESFPDLPEHGDCYFMPTVRTAFSSRQRINHDSLFVTYNTDIVPFHKLGQFVEYLQTRHEKSIRFKPCYSYNMVEFIWIRKCESDTVADRVATISVIFQSGSEAVSQGGVVEIKVEMEHEYKESELKLHIYGIVKTASVHVFQQTAKEIPTFSFRLAVACPLQSINPSKKQKSHFLSFQILTEDCIDLYCPECDQTANELESRALLWIQADYHGPRCFDIYMEGK